LWTGVESIRCRLRLASGDLLDAEPSPGGSGDFLLPVLLGKRDVRGRIEIQRATACGTSDTQRGALGFPIVFFTVRARRIGAILSSRGAWGVRFAGDHMCTGVSIAVFEGVSRRENGHPSSGVGAWDRRGSRLLCSDSLNWQRLGVEPLRTLHAAVVKPRATPDTPVAFYRQWRLTGLDGTVMDAPDSEANAVFGRSSGGRGEGAFPQVRNMSLVELGTHSRTPATLTQWYEALLAEMQTERIEGRCNRINPRVIKRKMSRWRKKRPADRRPSPLLKTFAQWVVMKT
jgi:hypothetical protein